MIHIKIIISDHQAVILVLHYIKILRGQRKKLVHAVFDLDIWLYQEAIFIFPYSYALVTAEATKVGPYYWVKWFKSIIKLPYYFHIYMYIRKSIHFWSRKLYLFKNWYLIYSNPWEILNKQQREYAWFVDPSGHISYILTNITTSLETGCIC